MFKLFTIIWIRISFLLSCLVVVEFYLISWFSLWISAIVGKSIMFSWQCLFYWIFDNWDQILLSSCPKKSAMVHSLLTKDRLMFAFITSASKNISLFAFFNTLATSSFLDFLIMGSQSEEEWRIELFDCRCWWSSCYFRYFHMKNLCSFVFTVEYFVV